MTLYHDNRDSLDRTLDRSYHMHLAYAFNRFSKKHAFAWAYGNFKAIREYKDFRETYNAGGPLNELS